VEAKPAPVSGERNLAQSAVERLYRTAKSKASILESETKLPLFKKPILLKAESGGSAREGRPVANNVNTARPSYSASQSGSETKVDPAPAQPQGKQQGASTAKATSSTLISTISAEGGKVVTTQGIGQGANVQSADETSKMLEVVRTQSETTLAQRVSQVEELLSKTGGSILRLVKDGGGKMTMKLDPPSLGKLNVEVEIIRGVCNARVIAEDLGVKAALVQGLPQLREALEAHGLKLEGFEVESQAHMWANERNAHGHWESAYAWYEEWDETEYRSESELKSDTEKVNTRPILGVVDLLV